MKQLFILLFFLITSPAWADSPTTVRKGSCKDGEVVVAVKSKGRVVCKNIIDVLDAAIKTVTPEDVPLWLKRLMLNYSRDGLVAPPSTDRPRLSSRYDWSKAVTKTGDYSYTIDREQCNKELGNLAGLSSQARIIPNYRAGKYQGFKLVGVRPNSFYRAIGIRSGDVVRKINGKEINSPNKALEMFETFQNASKATFEIERRGELLPLTYTIKGKAINP
jgi:membrane-associated protease RseP (regulator of RpoE activity)